MGMYAYFNPTTKELIDCYPEDDNFEPYEVKLSGWLAKAVNEGAGAVIEYGYVALSRQQVEKTVEYMERGRVLPTFTRLDAWKLDILKTWLTLNQNKTMEFF